MIIQMVVAADENNVIGKDNQLPWHLPKDLKFFKKMTLNAPVIMGRKTFESMGRPLPKRLNIVLTKQGENLPKTVMKCKTLQEALSFCEEEEEEKVSIIGGGQIFEMALPFVNHIYLTRVHTKIACGTIFFPPLDENIWECTWEEFHKKDEHNPYDFTFEKWQKVNSFYI